LLSLQAQETGVHGKAFARTKRSRLAPSRSIFPDTSFSTHQASGSEPMGESTQALEHAKTIYPELLARKASPDVAAQAAANARRWWRNSGMLLNSVLHLV
jgi:hypothetical protein